MLLVIHFFSLLDIDMTTESIYMEQSKTNNNDYI